MASKKSTKNDKIVDSNTQNSLDLTLTTEKPTTIIEKILSSLNAIQATDDTNSIQVGKDFNTISSSSTTPLPSVTSLSTLSAQFSTSLDPLSILDEITPEQALQKRTIGKLLNILNGLIVTPPSSEKLVVVTPKAPGFVNGLSANLENFPTVSTEIPSEQSTTVQSTVPDSSTTVPPATVPTTARPVVSELFTSAPASSEISPNNLSLATEELTTADSISTTAQATTPLSAPSSSTQESTTQINVESRIGATSEPDITTISDFTTQPPILTESTTLSSSTEAMITDVSNIQTTTVSSVPFPTTTEVGLNNSTEVISLYTLLSTLSPFKVSPDSVSIFSVNDLSNAITPEDIISTVTIASRSNFDNIATTPSSTTTEDSVATTIRNDSANEVTTDALITTDAATTLSSVQDTMAMTTTGSGPTSSTQSSVTMNITDIQTNNTTDSPSNQTNVSSTPTITGRSGRLLDFVQDPIQNSIDVSTPSTTTSTTPDYFIFAVLNDNTVLRKRPPTIPNKDTPYLVVGIYPNNTIVRKFPNGTIVPMEQILRVRGFDTRQNPPYIPEITSNQVTNDPGTPQDNANVQTVFIVNNFFGDRCFDYQFEVT